MFKMMSEGPCSSCIFLTQTLELHGGGLISRCSHPSTPIEIVMDPDGMSCMEYSSSTFEDDEPLNAPTEEEVQLSVLTTTAKQLVEKLEGVNEKESEPEALLRALHKILCLMETILGNKGIPKKS